MAVGQVNYNKGSLLNDYLGVSLADSEEQQRKRDIANNIGKGVSLASKMGSYAINSNNTPENLEYGSSSDTARGIRDTVGSVIPVFGVANSLLTMVGDAANTGNSYDEYGINGKPGYGQVYRAAGGAFDPAGNVIDILEKGGEGSGARALFSVVNPIGGGMLQDRWEQEQAKERKLNSEMIEKSDWQLNQFNFTPNLDV